MQTTSPKNPVSGFAKGIGTMSDVAAHALVIMAEHNMKTWDVIDAFQNCYVRNLDRTVQTMSATDFRKELSAAL